LAKDIHLAVQEATKDLSVPWKVELRTGDVSSARKKKQLEKLPDALITTPESLHLLLSAGNTEKIFENLQGIIVDEWHELFGSKRGVLVELALSRLKAVRPGIKIWGISATIGNLEQSLEVLLGNDFKGRKCTVVADIRKKIVIHSIIPAEIERFPWAGHLGIRLIPEILPIIEKSRSTLLFTNTRGQAEIWYQQLLNYARS
jgi:ATP-dependent Lhr-like helicase